MKKIKSNTRFLIETYKGTPILADSRCVIVKPFRGRTCYFTDGSIAEQVEKARREIDRKKLLSNQPTTPTP